MAFYTNYNNNNNPLKDDPVLKANLSRLSVVENRRGFRGWRQSFLERYEALVDPAGVEIARVAYQNLGKSLTSLMEIILKLKAFLGANSSNQSNHNLISNNNNNIIINNHNQNQSLSEVWSSVRAIRYLSEWTKQLTLSGTLLENLVPNTMQQEQQHGYTKFQMGVVLLRDRFAQFRRLVLCIDSLTSIEGPLRNVADRQTIDAMKLFRARFYSFCGILADIGLYPVLEKSQEIVQLEGSESEPEEVENQSLATTTTAPSASPEPEEEIIHIQMPILKKTTKNVRPDAFAFWEKRIEERLARKGNKGFGKSCCAASVSNVTEETWSLTEGSLDDSSDLSHHAYLSLSNSFNNSHNSSSFSSLRIPRAVYTDDLSSPSARKPPPRVVLNDKLLFPTTDSATLPSPATSMLREYQTDRGPRMRINSKDVIAERDDDDDDEDDYDDIDLDIDDDDASIVVLASPQPPATTAAADVDDDDDDDASILVLTSPQLPAITTAAAAAAAAAAPLFLSPAKKRLLFQWYSRLEQPNRETMKKKLSTTLLKTDITAADIDLLPWKGGGFMLDWSDVVMDLFSP